MVYKTVAVPIPHFKTVKSDKTMDLIPADSGSEITQLATDDRQAATLLSRTETGTSSESGESYWSESEVSDSDCSEEDKNTQEGHEKQEKKKKRIFGFARDKHTNYGIPDDYESRYSPDEYGQEMGPNARIWRVYLDEAELNDRDMVEGWKDGIDVLLVFAGLFSAVVTTFVTQTSQKLDQDFGQVSASLLAELIAIQRAIAAGSTLADVPASGLDLSSPPRFTTGDAWVNGLWFISLTLSLVTALSAVLIKQWIQHYTSFISGSPQERARIHHFRYMGIQRWSVPAIIGMLPVLLYVALFSFILGLVLFIGPLKPEIAFVVAGIGGITFVLYILSNGLPLVFPQCPYHTPVVEHLQSLITLLILTSRRLVFFLTHYAILRLLSLDWSSRFQRGRFAWIKAWRERLLKEQLPTHDAATLKGLESQTAQRDQDDVVCEIIHWLLTMSSNPSVKPITLEGISGLRFGFSCTAKLFGPQYVLAHYQAMLTQRYFSENYRVSAITHQPLFYRTERLIRASMFAPGSETIGISGFLDTDIYKIHDPDLALNNTHNELALATRYVHAVGYDSSIHMSDILQQLSPLIPTSMHYPMIWCAWYSYLKGRHNYRHWNQDSEVDFAGVYKKLTPYFKAILHLPKNLSLIMVSTNFQEACAVLLKLIFKALPQHIVQGFESLPEQLYSSPDALFIVQCKVREMLLRGIVMECQGNPGRFLEFDQVVSDACMFIGFWETFHKNSAKPGHATAYEDLGAVLHNLVTHPFFVHHEAWLSKAAYYYLFCSCIDVHCDLQLPSSSSPIPQRAFFSREHLCAMLTKFNCVAGLWGSLFSRCKSDPSGFDSMIITEITRVLERREIFPSTDPVINNAFTAFLGLGHVRNYLEGEKELLNGEFTWPSSLQPLVRWLLTYSMAYSLHLRDSEETDHHSSIHTFSTKLLQKPGFLAFTCAPLLLEDIGSKYQAAFSKESGILTLLAAYHKSYFELNIGHGIRASDLWRPLLTWVRKSVEIHNHLLWSKQDFKCYGHLTQFVDLLISVLEPGDPNFASEFRLPYFSSAYIDVVLELQEHTKHTKDNVRIQNEPSSIKSTG